MSACVPAKYAKLGELKDCLCNSLPFFGLHVAKATLKMLTKILNGTSIVLT